MMTWLLAAWLVAAASMAGLAVSVRLPWSAEARAVDLDRAVGLAVGPLLAGLAAVAVLWGLGGRSHTLHLGVVLALLSAGAIFGRSALRRSAYRAAGGRRELLGGLVLIAFAAGQGFDLAFVPLIQNDALEYATVGRILYEARDLAVYPAIDPQATRSGFFAPWTHPPLYTAMVYLANVVQGNAESAYALRWIAPWCLLAGVWVVLALGRMLAPAVGTVAAIVFISTPILFLGASSALIDPLPVLGMAIAFAALIGATGSPTHRGAVLGLMLGLALWTHSQAILFPFLLLPLLLLMPGAKHAALPIWARVPHVGPAALAALVVALVVGGAPYARNVALFGTPISDNPAVFAYAPLGFADYFRMQRGISNPVEIIQYGVLKGYFSIEAYSFAFWLALLGVPRAWRALCRQCGRTASTGAGTDPLLAGALGVFIMYTGATALSSALGIDLMIKNERYMLVLIPCIAVLAGTGLASPAGPSRYPLLQRGRVVLLVVVLALMPLQLFALVSYRQSQLRGDLVAFDEQAQLARWPHFEVMRMLRDETPAQAMVLSIKPADMFYSERRMISYLDPRLLPFYAETGSEDAAFRLLLDLGITHVHMTDYMLPPVYSSRLMSLVTDPRRATLVADSDGYQIYSLEREPSLGSQPPRWQEFGRSGWTLETHVVLGGRKSRARFVLGSKAYSWGEESVNDGFGGLFHRESGRMLISAPLDLTDVQAMCVDASERVQQALMTIEVAASGQAQMTLLALLHDAQGRLLQRRTLGDRPTSGRGSTSIQRRVPLPPQAATLTLQLEHRGASRLRLDHVRWAADCGTPLGAPIAR